MGATKATLERIAEEIDAISDEQTAIRLDVDRNGGTAEHEEQLSVLDRQLAKIQERLS